MAAAPELRLDASELESYFQVQMQRATRSVRRALGRLAVTALVAGAAAGCGAALPVATAGDAARAGIELADLQQGRQLVAAKCGGCHRTPVPAELRPDDWPHMLAEMARRSGVDGSQRHLMQQYLVTMATARAPR
jgi:mono/diheme cytochrome c family protein